MASGCRTVAPDVAFGLEWYPRMLLDLNVHALFHPYELEQVPRIPNCGS